MNWYFVFIYHLKSGKIDLKRFDAIVYGTETVWSTCIIRKSQTILKQNSQ